METISTLRDLYESYERIRVSIERVSENKETAASVLYRIQGSVSQLRALEKHCPPVKRDDNLKYLRTALRDIQKEFSAVERLITKLEIPEGFTFKAWYRGSDIKKHLEEAEKQIDKALHHFTFLSNVRQEYNQHEILSQVRKTADTTTRDRYSSHTTSHLRDKHSEQLLRKNHSSVCY
ncbi:hypothetical protein BDQ17DRAFT_168678 [Cyathus striatus]|nr:hypothetical protein BDQ17DRAFT_168678 [Cyathus striatus]